MPSSFSPWQPTASFPNLHIVPSVYPVDQRRTIAYKNGAPCIDRNRVRQKVLAEQFVEVQLPAEGLVPDCQPTHLVLPQGHPERNHDAVGLQDTERIVIIKLVVTRRIRPGSRGKTGNVSVQFPEQVDSIPLGKVEDGAGPDTYLLSVHSENIRISRECTPGHPPRSPPPSGDLIIARFACTFWQWDCSSLKLSACDIMPSTPSVSKY